MARWHAADSRAVPALIGARPWRLAVLGLLMIGATVGPPPPKTVAEALGLDHATAGADLDQRRAVAVAWHTARCMAGRGFVHVAVVERPLDIPDDDLDPVAWAQRWGFGISTATSAPAAREVPDPNLARIAALPPATRRSALRALFGDARRTGCAALAGAAIHGLRDREFAPLRGALADLAAAIERDPEVLAAMTRWRVCAGARAPRHEHLVSLIGEFGRRAAAARERAEALIALRREERHVATMIARCDQSYAADRTRVRARREAPFVERHRVMLEAIGARIRRTEAAYPSLPGSIP